MDEHPDAATDISATAADPLTSYERIIPHLLRNIIVVGILFLPVAFWFCRWSGAIGFVFGVAVSYINFRSLTRSVEGLTDRVANQNSREKGGLIVFRFLLRYGLVAAVAYVIFKQSEPAFRGFLAGLCVPVAALMIEAVWLAGMAFRRES
jgi:hypothetical protein